MRKTPRKCRPKMMTTTPAPWVNSVWFVRKKAPKALAAKPSSRKTVDRPRTKNSAGRITRRRASAAPVISRIEMPPM